MTCFMLWICPDCGGHVFILVTVDVLPLQVVALCVGCGERMGTIGEFKEGEEVEP